MSIELLLFMKGNSRLRDYQTNSSLNFPALGFDLLATLFLEGKRFHGSTNNPSLLPRELSSSPVGRPMQVPRTLNSYCNPSPIKNLMAQPPFRYSVRPSYPFEIAPDSISP
jgi:hypothetical protein